MVIYGASAGVGERASSSTSCGGGRCHRACGGWPSRWIRPLRRARRIDLEHPIGRTADHAAVAVSLEYGGPEVPWTEPVETVLAPRKLCAEAAHSRSWPGRVESVAQALGPLNEA